MAARSGQQRQQAGRRPGGMVAMIVPDYQNPFYTEIANAAEAELKGSDLGLLLAASHGSTEEEAVLVAELRELGVRGAILAPAATSATDLPAGAEDFPTVLLDCPAHPEGLCSLSVDNEAGGRMVGDHLISIGRDRIVYLAAPKRYAQSELRHAGLVAAVEAARLDPREVIQVIYLPAPNAIEGSNVAGQVLANEPTAVFCVNDGVALGLLRGLSEVGVDVPGEIAVAGFDDVPWSHALQTPLTTVAQPMGELGRAAVSMLADEIAQPGRHRHQQLVLQPRLIVRASTGTPAGVGR